MLTPCNAPAGHRSPVSGAVAAPPRGSSGGDAGEPVSEDYRPKDNAFNGKVQWVQVDVDAAAADADHLVGAEERFNLAMARQ
jgi:hypothetical protein